MKKAAHILITAGPTREPLDPIRFISNHSTGSMGFALAEESAKQKIKTTIIAGPVSLKTPPKVQRIDVLTAEEMNEEVKRKIKDADCLIMSAAVSDYTPTKKSSNKIKKDKSFELKLKRTKDILGGIKNSKVIKIGFALETDDLKKNAGIKIKNKKLDIIVANKITRKNNPFGGGKKEYKIFFKDGTTKRYKDVSKKEIAKTIIKEARRLIDEKKK